MKIEKKDKLLLISLICYFVLAFYLYLNCNKNDSVCNIISNRDSIKTVVFILLLIFGYFLMKYERERDNKISLYCIFTIVLCLGIVIFISSYTAILF